VYIEIRTTKITITSRATPRYSRVNRVHVGRPTDRDETTTTTLIALNHDNINASVQVIKHTAHIIMVKLFNRFSIGGGLEYIIKTTILRLVINYTRVYRFILYYYYYFFFLRIIMAFLQYPWHNIL